jgi:hypothetical protein
MPIIWRINPIARIIIPAMKRYGVILANGKLLSQLRTFSLFFLESLKDSGIIKIVPKNEMTNPAISIYPIIALDIMESHKKILKMVGTYYVLDPFPFF